MWKALLLLVVAADGAQPSMMLATFNQAFVSEADCRTFAADRSARIKVQAATDTGDAGKTYKIVRHRTDCVRDTSGQGV